ncbi:M23 family metallopeptidase [Aquimarina pacifica]|uniref:M23 family metallopeptidase n=1 Tax=Aquimarina pacifica TaxID=1296415 RepID=UPI0004707C5D|nr:M23 family metallopeptidase [Aquimarina pacifica]
MRNSSLFLLFSLFSVITFSQENFRLYYEETKTGYVILADNDEVTPVSVEMNLRLENLSSSNGNDKVFVVPKKTKGHIITVLEIVNARKRIKLGFESTYNFGDHNRLKYDDDFKYYLPFPKGEDYWLSQGYNGAVSHQNENSLDFKMPIGTKVYAARGGVVVDVEQSYTKRCTTSECAKYNNYILVYHEDGTFAEYTHLKQNGAKVKVGANVKIGQLIGLSGDVGWATGPHLHFTVFFQRLKKRETLKTKFLIGKGEEAVELIEKKKYMRGY